MSRKKTLHHEPDLAVIVNPLLSWYEVHARALPWRLRPTPYRVWLSEIMLQQTRVETVLPYFARFLAAAPDIAALAELPEERLLKLWEGLGYYSRAGNLRRAARRIMAEYGGIFPSEPAAIRSLPGIGDYTAGAIASIAFNLPEPAVDGNVLRVIARYTGSRNDVAAAAEKKRIAGLLREVYPSGRAGDFTQSLMELGALVCLPNGKPHCARCPLAPDCRARRENTAAEIPVKTGKKARQIQDRTILLLLCGGKVAIRRRPPSGLLAGLWEFPGFDEPLSPSAVRRKLKAAGLEPAAVEPLGVGRHVFSHREWRMTGYRVDCRFAVADLVWASPAELAERYPLPSALKVFRDRLWP